MTREDFIASLDIGLHEDNLRRLVAGLTPLIEAQGSTGHRTVFYVVQSVLADVLARWISDQPGHVALLEEIQESLIPKIKAAAASADQSPAVQIQTTDALVEAYVVIGAR